RFDGGQRLIRLRAGRLAVRVARDGRPFIVETAQGRVQALGTRFTVAQLAGRSEVTVLEHSVRVTVTGGLDRALASGEGAVFDGDRIELLPRDARARSAWTDGVLDVRDEPLAAVIDALRPYQHGLIRISPEAGRLRVFGVFPLDRPEQVLQDLVDTQPIRVRRWGRWVTLIDRS
ncbi:MAG TPA: FecR domain-containing protein, partial [Burkholderiaceae bacterium]|nr:FecR domain-containing protein [Burkholderiaceae bacterium]